MTFPVLWIHKFGFRGRLPRVSPHTLQGRPGLAAARHVCTGVVGWYMGHVLQCHKNAILCAYRALEIPLLACTYCATMCCLRLIQPNTLAPINLSSELSWSPHVSSVVSKTNSTLGFLRRNLRKCPSELKETAYYPLCDQTWSMLQQSGTLRHWLIRTNPMMDC